MNQRRFPHIHIAGEWEPAFHDPNLSLVQACDRYAAQAKAAGTTALQLNFIPTPYHPLFHLYPDEVYLFFGNYGASLDLFAESDYNRAIWPRWMLEENLNRLRHLGRAAEQHGLTGLLYLCEPRLQHPEIFRRYPHWRGPRVDNPNHSQTPLFALDTDRVDVLEHYRQMLRQVLDAAPSIRHIVLFSQDSGSGFSHAQHLYSGPNGPAYNRAKSFSKRVMDFCEGLRVDSRLEVTLTTSWSNEEWEQLQAAARDGIHLAVRGAQSWTGGLEDQWAWNQCGAERLAKIGFDAAREERVVEFQARCETVRRHGRRPRCLSPAPNEHYFQLAYVPNPWEPLEILQRYEQWGAEQLFLRGHVTDDDQLPFNVNQAACARFLRTPGLSPEDAVTQTLAAWVDRAAVNPLTEALRHVARAVRFRPNFCPFLEREPQLFPGPLVPDPTKLTRAEKEYYWHNGQETLCKIKGDYYWLPSLNRGQLEFIFSQFGHLTLSSLRKAYDGFEEARKAARGNEPSLRCIAFQEQHTRLYECLQTTLQHLAQMTAQWRGVKGVEVPAPSAIVAAEIANTQRWSDLLGEHPEVAVRLAPFRGVMYSATMHLRDDLRRRVEVMTKHQGDAVHLFDAPGPMARKECA